MEYKFISTKNPLYQDERKLRYKILVEPFGFQSGVEVFPGEDRAYHLVAIEDGCVVGCVVFLPDANSGRLCQMAILNGHQKRGIGTKLVLALEKKLIEDGFEEIHLHARDHAIPFYKKLGYEIDGEPFIEVGIKHYIMRKKLTDN